MTARRQLLYMLGQFGVMLLTRYLYQWVLKFVDSPAGDATLLAAASVGTVFLGFRIFDGITDPMAGGLSDWWVSRGRKRQALIGATAFLAPVGLALTFCPAESMSLTVRWVLLVSGLFVFFVGYTVYAIPYWTLVEDFGQTEEGRRSLSNMLGLGLILATITGFVVTPLVIEALGYRDAAVVIGLVSFACMLAPLYAAPKDEAVRPVTHSTPTLGELLRTFAGSFRNRRFVALLVLLVGSQMSFTVLTAAAPFVARDLLGGTDADVALMLGPLLLTSVPMFYFSPKLSAKLGWWKALLLASLVLGGVYVLCSLVVGTAVVHTPFLTASLLFAACGPMIAVLLALEAEAITACVGPDEKGAVSMYFGVYNFVIKCFNGVAMLLTAVLIDLAKGPWGTGATRFMLTAAALLLFSGVGLSVVLRRR